MCDAMMRVGVVGVGNLGREIARKLVESSFEVMVYDINVQAQRRAEKLGAKSASSLEKLGDSCRMFLIALPNPDAVTAVVSGEGGLLSWSKPGNIIVDMGTTDPSTTRRNAEIAAKNGVGYLDAPIIGVAPQPEHWTIMVGGEEETYKNCKGVLEAIGGRLFYVGGSGSAHALKLVNNCLSAVYVASLAEMMALAGKVGLNPKTVYEALSEEGYESATVNRIFRQKIPKMIDRDFDTTTFTLGLLGKDLDLAVSMGREAKMPLLIARSAQLVHDIARDRGLEDKDPSAIVTVFEDIFEKA